MTTVELQTSPPPALPSDLLESARVLLLLQGGLAVLASVEATFWLFLAGPATQVVSVLLTAAGAVAALVLAARIVRGGRASRVIVLVMELAILAVTVVDLLLALFVAKGSIGMMPTLTRVVLPIAIIGLVARTGSRGRR